MRCDAFVHIRLFATSCNGPRMPIPAGIYRGTMMFDESRGWDFRADLAEDFAPGDSRDVSVAFLSTKEVTPLLSRGRSFRIWAGRFIGEGRVLESFV